MIRKETHEGSGGPETVPPLLPGSLGDEGVLLGEKMPDPEPLSPVPVVVTVPPDAPPSLPVMLAVLAPELESDPPEAKFEPPSVEPDGSVVPVSSLPELDPGLEVGLGEAPDPAVVCPRLEA